MSLNHLCAIAAGSKRSGRSSGRRQCASCCARTPLISGTRCDWRTRPATPYSLFAIARDFVQSFGILHANVYPHYWYQNLVSEWRPRYIHCTAHIARLGAVPRFCRGGPVQMWQGCWMKVAGVSGTCIEQAVEHDGNMIESYI